MTQARHGWLRSFLDRSAESTRRRKARRVPQAERLEERLVPALLSPPDRLLPAAAAPVAVAAPDLDGDGRPDLAALSAGGVLTVARNAGDGTWVSATPASLGVAAATGFAFGAADRDPLIDVAVQTPDGLLVAAGDGAGRFSRFRALTPGAAGAFAGPAGARVDPAFLPGADPARPGLVAVSPQADEVWVFPPEGDGGFGTPARLPSGADGPVALAVGDWAGDARADVAVGHRDGTVTVFEGTAAGLVARPDLAVAGLGPVAALRAGDADGDGLADLAVAAGDRAWLLTGRGAAPVALANGDFAQGLAGWERVSGTVTAGGGAAEFREHGSDLLSALRRELVAPGPGGRLTFEVVRDALEPASPGGLPDAFEVSLIGPDGRSLVPTFRPDATAAFHLRHGRAADLAPGVTFDGRRVSIGLGSVPAGTPVTAVFHLLGHPAGAGSVVTVDAVRLSAGPRAEGFARRELAGPWVDARDVAIADATGDGVPDVAVADGPRVALFSGPGWAREEYALPAGASATSLAAAPLTAGDAVPDLVVGSAGTAGVYSALSAGGGAPLDLPPRLAAPLALAGTEGTPVALDLAFADADGGGPYAATVDWGDGSPPEPAEVILAGGTGRVTASHVYADNGSYRVRVTLRATGGAFDVLEGTAAVANAAPTLDLADRVVELGDDAEWLLGTFADLGFTDAARRVAETFRATVDWGDGTPAPFARLVVRDGSAGVPTAGDVFAGHAYARPGVYTVTVTLSDDDGGEVARSFRLTVRPRLANAGVWWVPGNPGDAVPFQIDFLSASTDYDNELGYVVVDDAAGRLGGLLPGDPGWRAAALAHPSRRVAIARADDPGAGFWAELPAGTHVAFYLVADGTTAQLLAGNPGGELNGAPRAWFSPDAANADGGAAHFRRTDEAGGWVQYAAEDMDRGGDNDFNDLVFRVGPARPAPAIQSLAPLAGVEGTAVTLSGAFADPVPDSAYADANRRTSLQSGLVAPSPHPPHRPKSSACAGHRPRSVVSFRRQSDRRSHRRRASSRIHLLLMIRVFTWMNQRVEYA